MTYKELLAILPVTSPTQPSLPKFYFDHFNSKMQTMNDNIHNDIKTFTDMTNYHQSEIIFLNNKISDLLQKLTATTSKTDKHEKIITEISSKLSDYEYRLEKLIIKDTQIQTLSLQIINTSSKTENHEVQHTSFTSIFSYYETRLEKLSTSNINKIDIEIKENEENDDMKAATSSFIHPLSPHPNSHNYHSSSNQTSADITKCPLIKSPDFHSNLSHMTLEGDTLLQLQNLWDVICSYF